jgi:farnesyl diphosphate synthase
VLACLILRHHNWHEPSFTCLVSKIAADTDDAAGCWYQVQDDYLDCYGDPAVIGKVGTDIEDNKCSWLVCQALLLADKKQLATLNANYGIDSPSKVRAVQ